MSTNTTEILQVFQFGVALVGLAYLYFWLYKDYRVECFRQNLFKIRDRLFDQAAAGVVSFDDPVYKALRDTLNRFIQYGHRVRIMDAIVFGLIDHKYPYIERNKKFPHILIHAIEKLPKGEAKKLYNNIFGTLCLEIAKHLCFYTFFGFTIIFSWIFYKVIIEKEQDKTQGGNGTKWVDSSKVLYSKGQNDECYTPRYAVTPILKYIPKDAVVWCPFDKFESEFVRMLRMFRRLTKLVYSHIAGISCPSRSSWKRWKNINTGGNDAAKT